ncbi:hypothetical protein BDU57DRAFT_573327 [Ampelomyces quisqualis]|uniref:Uncharacterized protein n=1 Tax=Ampelomyces quisqualis TaxID=50730 RepID=A0A6A5QLZ5_AMPQU|nr:hypothetical protein BDU57DRAFT_573327 [Ampelomyces quisqualis]
MLKLVAVQAPSPPLQNLRVLPRHLLSLVDFCNPGHHTSVAYTTPTDEPGRIFHCHCIDHCKPSSSPFGTSAIFPFFSIADMLILSNMATRALLLLKDYRSRNTRSGPLEGLD